jgi:hypothetical protein
MPKFKKGDTIRVHTPDLINALCAKRGAIGKIHHLSLYGGGAYVKFPGYRGLHLIYNREACVIVQPSTSPAAATMIVGAW